MSPTNAVPVGSPLPPLHVVTPDVTVAAGGAGRRRARAAAASKQAAVRSTEGTNAYVFTLDASTAKPLAALGSLIETLKAPKGGAKGELVAKRWRFHSEAPNWKSDIRWVSAADAATFRDFFVPLFHKLAIAEAFLFLGCAMVPFSGFFVVRKDTQKSYFHKDFTATGGKAFTLMTPLYDMSDLPDCHLLCRVPAAEAASRDEAREPLALASAGAGKRGSSEGEPRESQAAAREPIGDDVPECPLITKQYRYTLGEAIVFDDDFEHATETGTAPRTLAFLCFTFGDRQCTEAQWNAAQEYIREQGPIYSDPRGNLVGSGVTG